MSTADTILLLFLDDFVIFELEIANKSEGGVLKYETLVSLIMNSTGETSLGSCLTPSKKRLLVKRSYMLQVSHI